MIASMPSGMNYNPSDIQALYAGTSSPMNPGGNPDLVNRIIKGQQGILGVAPGLINKNFGSSVIDAMTNPTNAINYDFSGGQTLAQDRMTNGGVWDKMKVGADYIKAMLGDKNAMEDITKVTSEGTASGTLRSLGHDPDSIAKYRSLGLMTDRETFTSFIKDPRIGKSPNQDRLLQQQSDDQSTLANLQIEGVKASLGVSITGTKYASLMTNSGDLLSAGGSTWGTLNSAASEVLSGKQAELSNLQSIYEFKKQIYGDGSGLPPDLRLAQQKELAGMQAQIGQSSLEYKQMQSGFVQTGAGLMMGESAIQGSYAGIEMARAQLYGGASETLSARGSQYSSLETKRGALQGLIDNPSTPIDVLQKSMAQLNEVIEQQTVLYQRSQEEFHGMLAAVSGIKAGTAMSGYGAAVSSGMGPVGSVSIGGAALPSLRSEVGELQQRASIRYQSIVASGQDPNQNAEYLQMVGEIANKQGALAGTQNTLTGAPLGADARLTMSQLQFTMGIAQMLPGTGANMFQATAGIVRQSGQNIGDINHAYQETVRQNGGVETPEMRFIHGQQVMEQMMNQAGAISSLTTGIEGRMIQSSINTGPNSAIVDPTYSRRAAYGSGWAGILHHRRHNR